MKRVEKVVSELNYHKTKFKIEREHSKRERMALRDLEELLRDDVEAVLLESIDLSRRVENHFERFGGKDKFDGFLIKKLDEALLEQSTYIEKLSKLRELSKLRFKDMTEAYVTITKTRKLNIMVREYTYRLKEETTLKGIKSVQ